MFARLLLASFVLVLSTTSARSDSSPETIFEFVSAPGDYVGAGQSVVITPSTAQFSAVQQSWDNSIYVFVTNNVAVFWSAFFSAPGGLPLQVGTYTGASRYPFQGASPGLSVYGDGRGCDEDFGQFTISELSVDPSTGTVLKLAVDYVQYCENASAAPLTGSIRINSAVPVPEVIAPIITLSGSLNSRGCAEATSPAGALVTATASTAASGAFNFNWSSSGGKTASGPSFQFPVALNQTTTIMLTATDPSTGKYTTVSSPVCASDTTPPIVKILSPVAGQSYPNLPQLAVQVTDLVDKHIKTVQVSVGENAAYLLNGNEQLHTQISARRAVGDMISTQISVSATDASGNTGTSSVEVLIHKAAF